MKEPDLMEDCLVIVVMCAVLLLIFSYHLLTDMKEEKIKSKTSAIVGLNESISIE